MNKLVIVGNGFDLAHDLQTSYNHFMNDFWSSLEYNRNEELIKEVISINEMYLANFPFSKIKNFKDFNSHFRQYVDENGYDFVETRYYCRNNKTSGFKVVFEFRNLFFKQINLKSLENWIDIENEYFNQLKIISKRKITSYNGSREEADKNQIIKNKLSAKKLNDEFSIIKRLLKSYLIKTVQSQYNFSNGRILNFDKLLQLFEVKPLYLSKTNENNIYLTEFQREDYEDLLKFDDELVDADTHSILQPFLNDSEKKTVFLNFNYTSSLYPYINLIKSKSYGNYYKSEIISIHGLLENYGDFEINFGFGDEMDEDYKFIENLNDNEYLMNFKSFKYLRNRHYKNLLDYIDSDKFQVYIMGHSCGLSDRTLLNTIFEHEYCRSIKVFYHKREDGSDNFTEIVQNVSRHFDDKKLMRSKIVNKELCQPLPQNARFEKKSTAE